MSLLEPKARMARLIAAAGITLGLGGCFQPLYAPNATGGVNVADALASIDVRTPTTGQNQERLGHYVRNELVFDLDGSGQPKPKAYTLDIALTESLATAVVNSQTGQADAATLTVRGTYTLKRLAGEPPLVTTATAIASTTYDRGPQRFANVRAARDAEIRAAKQLAEQIRTRLAAYFASHP
jgi:LPS-assembly lipoprotein